MAISRIFCFGRRGGSWRDAVLIKTPRGCVAVSEACAHDLWPAVALAICVDLHCAPKTMIRKRPHNG